MGRNMQIIKRLALGIPTLVLISSIVFFLSKLMPGTSGAFLLDDRAEMGFQTQFSASKRAYKAYLQRTGQDKPLFYFSIASLAEPDTLYKIFPDDRQRFLKNLCFNFGNWPFIEDYYHSLNDFQNSITETRLSGTDTQFLHLPTLAHFFTASSKDEIAHLLSQTEKFVSANYQNTQVQATFADLKSSFLQMNDNRRSFQKWIPAIHFHGLDNQYHQWLSNSIKGDLGISLRNSRPVVDLIKNAIGITLLMTIASLALGWIFSLAMALFINLPAGKMFERPLLSVLYVLDVFPLFLLSFLVLIVFSGGNFSDWLPSFGLGNYRLIDNFFVRTFYLSRHLILPIFSMTLVTLPYLTGQIDRSLKEVNRAEYVKTARAKGLSEPVILIRHTLRNAWTPLITIFTENLPTLLSGALVVEVIFAIPGMGRLLVGAVSGRDYPLVLGIVILVASVKIFSNILGDVLYRLSDPRVKPAV